MSEPTITKLEGTLSYVDSKGNVTEMYPEIKTDEVMNISGKAADAKAVGDKLNIVGDKLKVVDDKLKKALYIDSFDPETGVLNTASDK